jgi:hypothetical protein
MKLALAILSILACGSLAAAEEQFTIIGTVNKLAHKQISVKTPRGLFLIATDTDDNSRTPLKVGDEISVRCKPDAAGKPVAVKIWANIVTFSAIVRYVDGDDIEVLTIPNADYPKEEHRVVHLQADTAFGTSRKDLTVGQRVRIVGLDVGDGAVDAARIAIYNTDMPATR